MLPVRRFDAPQVRMLVNALEPKEQLAIRAYTKGVAGIEPEDDESEALDELLSEPTRQFSSVFQWIQVARDEELPLIIGRMSPEKTLPIRGLRLKLVDQIIWAANLLDEGKQAVVTTTAINEFLKKEGMKPIDDLSTLVRHLTKPPNLALEIVSEGKGKRLSFRLTTNGLEKAKELKRLIDTPKETES